jgi:hypothetical protein
MSEYYDISSLEFHSFWRHLNCATHEDCRLNAPITETDLQLNCASDLASTDRTYSTDFVTAFPPFPTDNLLQSNQLSRKVAFSRPFTFPELPSTFDLVRHLRLKSHQMS